MLKNTTKLLVALALSSTTLLAQVEFGEKTKPPFTPGLSFGMKGGVHFSKYQFVPRVSQDQHMGMAMGVMGRYDIERGASAQVEINYISTGWKERYDDAATSSQRKIQYVEIPLLSHLYIGSGLTKFFVNIGPYFGFHLGDTHTASGASFTESQTLRQTMPIKNKLAWGLMGGPGVGLNLGKHHRIEVEGRIAYNFQDIWSNERTAPYGQSTELRMGVMLGYSYRF